MVDNNVEGYAGSWKGVVDSEGGDVKRYVEKEIDKIVDEEAFN